jgi:chemotaxis protein MotB
MAELRGQAIPVIKKVVKKGHGGHHGGAWKVAYADFVTAMMALFMVLWIIGQSSKEAKEAIADYFRQPGIFTTTGASGRKIVPIVPDPLPSGKSGSFNMPPAKPPLEALADILHLQQKVQEQTFKQVGEHLQARLAALPELHRLKDQVAVEITDEGLRIELVDKEGSSFFEVGSAQFKSESLPVLRAIASEIRHLPNAVVIEGHTDSRPFALASSRSNWELSTDRAHSARRLMENFQVSADQIAHVRGYADRQLRYPDQPYDVRNRRISIAILYSNT